MGPRRMRIGRGESSTTWKFYHSSNIARVIKSRRLRWAGHVAQMEEGRSTFKILTGKHTTTRPLVRPRSRWEANIRMDIEENRYQYE